jgi:hypothetical protein
MKDYDLNKHFIKGFLTTISDEDEDEISEDIIALILCLGSVLFILITQSIAIPLMFGLTFLICLTITEPDIFNITGNFFCLYAFLTIVYFLTTNWLGVIPYVAITIASIYIVFYLLILLKSFNYFKIYTPPAYLALLITLISGLILFA